MKNRFLQNRIITGRMIKRVIAAVSGILLVGCAQEEVPHTANFKYLSMPVYVEVPEAENHRLRGAVSVVRNELDDLKGVFDWNDPDSEYMRMNSAASEVWLPISYNMERLLKYSLDYYVKTRGCFDITVTPLCQIWGFEGAEVPDIVPREVVAAAMMVTGVERVILANNAVRYDVSVLHLNFSGILEGYLTDLSLIRVRNRNYRNALINIGSSYRMLGEQSPGEFWQVPVANPFDPESTLGTVTFKDKIGMSVSSTKDKYNLINGFEVGHIIDPRNGYPATNIVQTVVVGPTATASDALATSLTVGGVEEAPAIMYNFPRYDALMVLNEQPLTVWMTEGMSEYMALDDVPEDRQHVLPAHEPTEEELAGAIALPKKKLPEWNMRVFRRPEEVAKMEAEKAEREAAERKRLEEEEKRRINR